MLNQKINLNYHDNFALFLNKTCLNLIHDVLHDSTSHQFKWRKQMCSNNSREFSETKQILARNIVPEWRTRTVCSACERGQIQNNSNNKYTSRTRFRVCRNHEARPCLVSISQEAPLLGECACGAAPLEKAPATALEYRELPGWWGNKE